MTQREQNERTQREKHGGTQQKQPIGTQREHPQSVFRPEVSPLENLRWVEMAVDGKSVLTVQRMEKKRKVKEVLESVKSHGGDVVSEKRVHDVFKDIHDRFIEIKAPRSGLVLGTEDNISNKTPQLQREKETI